MTGWEVPWIVAVCRSDYPPGSNLPYQVNKLRVVDIDPVECTLSVSIVRYDATGMHEDQAPQAMVIPAGSVDQVFDVALTTNNLPGERWLRITRSNGSCTGRLIALGYYNEILTTPMYTYTEWVRLSCGRPFDTNGDTGYPQIG